MAGLAGLFVKRVTTGLFPQGAQLRRLSGLQKLFFRPLCVLGIMVFPFFSPSHFGYQTLVLRACPLIALQATITIRRKLMELTRCANCHHSVFWLGEPQLSASPSILAKKKVNSFV